MDQMRQHAQLGADLLARSARMWDGSHYLNRGAEIALYHHERYDGVGYPNRLGGTDIPLSARIVAVADVYDALISARSYKAAWSAEQAAAYIVEHAGSQFDPTVVEAFQHVLVNRVALEVVRWSPEMSVGIATIDRDHRILISLLNQLASAEDRQDRINLEEVLDELVSYTLYHFDKEEGLMAACGYPHLSQHAATHSDLTERVLAIRHRFFEHHQEWLGEEIMAFLVNWLRSHIMGEDMKYAPYMATITPEAKALPLSVDMRPLLSGR